MCVRVSVGERGHVILNHFAENLSMRKIQKPGGSKHVDMREGHARHGSNQCRAPRLACHMR